MKNTRLKKEPTSSPLVSVMECLEFPGIPWFPGPFLVIGFNFMDVASCQEANESANIIDCCEARG